MAQSRLEKIGTIFSRVTGLLRTGAMKFADKPIWYDVYMAHPPKLNPTFDRPAPTNIEIKNIFFAEDVIRSKYHKSLKQHETVNLLSHKQTTHTQSFISIYNNLKAEGAIDEEQIFNTAQEILSEKLKLDPKFKSSEKEVRSPQEDETKNATAINVKTLFD